MVTDRREAQIVDNIGLVHALAKRFKERGCEYDDLFQAGCVGLIKAVDGFDESRGFAFSTYAVPVIMGEMKRLFRDGGAVKISRSLKEQSVKVQTIRERFMRREMREPTVSELAALTGTDIHALAEILNLLSPVLSLSAGGEDGEEAWDVPVDDSDALFDRLTVHQLTAKLSPAEQKLIRYRFYEGKTQCETASLLGISQVQVSRREKALLLKLRASLE